MRRVALVGNPNSGKTTLFNELCGARQQTGNYAGVTVEKKTGLLKGSDDIEIIDLPGTYSLVAKSADEEIATAVVTGRSGDVDRPDLLVLVLDASNLKRSLYLVEQARGQNVPMIAALTMTDIAERRGVTIDAQKLAKSLGFSVIEVRHGIVTDLADAIRNFPVAKKPVHVVGQNLAPDAIYSAVDKHLVGVVTRSAPRSDITRKIDTLLTHRFFGLLAFAVIIGSIFFAIYAGARPLMDAIDAGMKYVGLSASHSLATYPMTASLIADGAIAGAGSVLVFVPQILILFLLIGILEETGYLARAAFLMDRVLGWTGLNGRAFIPLLSSFACAVPGILSARVMPSDRARMATILIAPLMSCSARLPVYVLFIGAFIEPRYGALAAAASLFLMHFVGIAVAMPIAWLLNHKILKTAESPFILELPEYRMPRFINLWRRTYDAVTNFIKRVGTVIFALSIVIWALAYFPHNEKSALAGVNPASVNAVKAAYLSDSYLGRVGRAVEPAFRPLGFDWKISVAVLAAFPAREVFVSTLGIIYSVSDAKENSEALGKKLVNDHKNPIVAFSIMVFFALCAQCMSTLATIRRELMSTRWAVAVFFVMTGLAYVAAFLVYQLGGRI